MPHLYISAAHKSSGKTTLTLGLCAALRERRLTVQPFKKGPDYIDPIWLTMASGRDCRNLDFHTMGHSEIRGTFAHFAQEADISLIEGNKGLYDGLDLEGNNSNAALASLLGAPVVLVLDVRGVTRGVAPLILGYQAFDAKIRIAGVILNQVGGSRHEGKLRAVIERYTDVPVLGAVAREPSLQILERHLGLTPGHEMTNATEIIERIRGAVGSQVDIDRVVGIAERSRVPQIETPPSSQEFPGPDVRLGIARDAAFGFYYAGDLEALRRAGAELVFIDTLHDRALPALDGLFIGGGFPETQMEALEANGSMRRSIRNAIVAGLPVYAECGGLMYLTRSIVWSGRRCEMVGAIPADTVMYDRPQGRGYVRLRETGKGHWPLRTHNGALAELNAHEFHYSDLVNRGGNLEYAYKVLRGRGIDGEHDGVVYRNVLASFSHLRDVAANHWAERFVTFVRSSRQSFGYAASL